MLARSAANALTLDNHSKRMDSSLVHLKQLSMQTHGAI